MLNKLVLIVDDNVDARMIFGAILNYDGYRVIEAADGRQGLDAAISRLPEIILMDVMMPVMNGFAAASAIRRHATTCRIPIVAVSGNLFTVDEEDELHRLFDGYLMKPITPTIVLREVQRLIGLPHS